MANLLIQNTHGRVPFADVAFDVGPEEHHQANSNERARYFAHRVVVAAHSPMLLEELDQLPMQALKDDTMNACIFRVDRRIPKDVWRMVLQFMYSGMLTCHFAEDGGHMTELLRACCMYKLPKPLLNFAQASLFQLLPRCPPIVALHAFSVVTDACSEGLDLRCIREASTHILLRSASQAFQTLPPSELSKILERLIQVVEDVAFQVTAARQQKQLHRQATRQRQQEHPAAVRGGGNWPSFGGQLPRRAGVM